MSEIEQLHATKARQNSKTLPLSTADLSDEGQAGGGSAIKTPAPVGNGKQALPTTASPPPCSTQKARGCRKFHARAHSTFKFSRSLLCRAFEHVTYKQCTAAVDSLCRMVALYSNSFVPSIIAGARARGCSCSSVHPCWQQHPCPPGAESRRSGRCRGGGAGNGAYRATGCCCRRRRGGLRQQSAGGTQQQRHW